MCRVDLTFPSIWSLNYSLHGNPKTTFNMSGHFSLFLISEVFSNVLNGYFNSRALFCTKCYINTVSRCEMCPWNVLRYCNDLLITPETPSTLGHGTSHTFPSMLTQFLFTREPGWAHHTSSRYTSQSNDLFLAKTHLIKFNGIFLSLSDAPPHLFYYYYLSQKQKHFSLIIMILYVITRSHFSVRNNNF